MCIINYFKTMRTIKLDNKNLIRFLQNKDKNADEIKKLTKNIVRLQKRIDKYTKEQEKESLSIENRFNTLKGKQKREDEKVSSELKRVNIEISEFEELIRIYLDDKTNEVCIEIEDAVERFKTAYKEKKSKDDKDTK